MIRRVFRCIARWNHRQLANDCAFMLRVHRAHQRDLPAEIERIERLQRFHEGRIATLSEPRDPVNYRLGRTTAPAINGKRQAR